MKKIYKSISAVACSLLFVFVSCTGDLNTLPLTDTTILPETAWAKDSTYENFVAKIYSTLSISGNMGPNGYDDIVNGDQGEATFIRSYWNLQELPTDEAVIAWSDDGLNGLQFNQWTSSNRFCRLTYDRTMINVAYCNEFLRQTTDDKLTSRGLTQDKIAAVHVNRAEVRALRAFNYLVLMDLYANVPFVTEEDGVGAYDPVQKDRTFLFPWIESELKACEGNLPEKSTLNYGKVNDATVWMMLAKLYLNAVTYISVDHYTDCLTYLNKIMGAGYTLEKNYQNSFCADNDKSSEIIFPILFDGKNATTYGGTTYLMAAAFGSDMNPGVTYGLGQSWSGIRSTQALSSLFEEGDTRALFYKDKRTQNCTTWGDYNTGWAVVKYTNLNKDGSAGSDNLFADTDFPFYRLADAYLMYAEAVLRGGTGGSKAQALTYVNDLRSRAKTSLISESDLTLDFILDERARELYWEGHRRTDLIRYGYFTEKKTWPWKNGVYAGTAKIDSKYNLYPIPSTDLTVNTNLKQNPGF